MSQTTSPTTTPPTFHPLPRLPYELRLLIWEATISPRRVEVDFLVLNQLFHQPQWTHRLVSLTPPPAILSTCRESREVGLKVYKKVFLGLRRPIPYVWLNPRLDELKLEQGAVAYAPSVNAFINAALSR
ncbi:hypothetical protein B0H65DRAFT_444048 [Neurospora tetraspora]|uniref:2EXR domain-containing protein n=1 Tax=Neurospora tetraspora TaxID=94610 RepID=A0AAE0JEE3_9PEZI|nr:hypothetical protein B0H65DRAFT_444048 [Neurospora tetraspora]